MAPRMTPPPKPAEIDMLDAHDARTINPHKAYQQLVDLVLRVP